MRTAVPSAGDASPTPEAASSLDDRFHASRFFLCSPRPTQCMTSLVCAQGRPHHDCEPPPRRTGFLPRPRCEILPGSHLRNKKTRPWGCLAITARCRRRRRSRRLGTMRCRVPGACGDACGRIWQPRGRAAGRRARACRAGDREERAAPTLRRGRASLCVSPSASGPAKGGCARVVDSQAFDTLCVAPEDAVAQPHPQEAAAPPCPTASERA